MNPRDKKTFSASEERDRIRLRPSPRRQRGNTIYTGKSLTEKAIRWAGEGIASFIGKLGNLSGLLRRAPRRKNGESPPRFIHTIGALDDVRPGDWLIIVGELVFTALKERKAQPPGERFVPQPDRPARPPRWELRSFRDKTRIKVWVNRALFRGPVPIHRVSAYPMMDYYTTWAMAQKRRIIAIGGYSPKEDMEDENRTILYVVVVDENGTIQALDERSLASQLHDEDYFYDELMPLLEELRRAHPRHTVAWLAPLLPWPKARWEEYSARFAAGGLAHIGERLFQSTHPAHRISNPAHVLFSERYGLSLAILILALLVPVIPYWQLRAGFSDAGEGFDLARRQLEDYLQNQPGLAGGAIPIHPDTIEQRKDYMEETEMQSQRLVFLFHFLGEVAKIQGAIIREVDVPLLFRPTRPTVPVKANSRLEYDPKRAIRIDIALPRKSNHALEQGRELVMELHKLTNMALSISPTGWVEEEINRRYYRRYTVLVPF